MKRMSMQNGVYGLVGVCFLLFVGCSGSTTSPEQKVEQFCKGAFNVHVRKGTNAGLAVTGTLEYIQVKGTSNIQGLVKPANAENDRTKHIDVNGTVVDGKISMTFTLPDQRVITGTGDYPKSGGCSTELKMLGDAKGPGADDTGDWDGAILAAAVAAASPYICYYSCRATGGTVKACDKDCGF